MKDVETAEAFTDYIHDVMGQGDYVALLGAISRRDLALTQSAAAAERGRIVARLRAEAEQYSEIDHARDWFTVAADLIERESEGGL